MVDYRSFLHKTWAQDPSNPEYIEILLSHIPNAEKTLAAEITEHLAHYYLTINDLTYARTLLKRGIKQTKDFALIHSLALIEMEVGNIRLAIEELQRALTHAPQEKSMGIHYEIASISEHLGDCYDYQGGLLQAITLWQKAEQEYNLAAATLERANVLRKLAKLLLKQQDTASAKDYLETALILFQNIKEGVALADCYVQLSKISHQSSKSTEANHYETLALCALEKTQQYDELVMLIMQQNKTNDISRYAKALIIALEHTAPLEALIDLGSRWHWHTNDGSKEQIWVSAAVLNKAEAIGHNHERYPELFRIALDNYFRALKSAGIAENEIMQYTKNHQLDSLNTTSKQAIEILDSLDKTIQSP